MKYIYTSVFKLVISIFVCTHTNTDMCKSQFIIKRDRIPKFRPGSTANWPVK